MKKQKKRLSVGVDFGTSWSKLILRDEAARSGERFIVVRPSLREGGDGSFRIPSLVAFQQNAFRFGFLANEAGRSSQTQLFTSFKMRVAYPQQIPASQPQPPEGITLPDICALYVCSLMQYAYKSAERYLANHHLNQLTPEILPTLGVPMAYYQDEQIRERFVRIALQGFFLFRNYFGEKGTIQLDLTQEEIPLRRAIEDCEASRCQAESFIHNSDAEEENWRREWVRSEAEASVLWIFRAPSTSPGLYGTVDIGAGTTIANWIMICQSPEICGERTVWRNSRLGFFGSCCRPPGMDALGIALMQRFPELGVLGVREREDDLSLEAWRQHQATLSIHSNGRLPRYMRNIFDRIYKTYQTAAREAYGRYPLQSRWDDTTLLLFGGGSLVNLLRNEFNRSPWGNIRAPHRVGISAPNGLVEENGSAFRGTSSEHIFLLVAYGLSHYLWDVPSVDTPGEIPPFVVPPSNTSGPCSDTLYPK